MTKWFTKILAFALSALVLLSTMSWSVEKHLCMGRVMDVAFFHPADHCGMEEAMSLEDEASENHHCCDNESFFMEGQDDLKLSWDELDIDVQQFLVAYSYACLELLAISLDKAVIQTPYPPPPLVRDLNLLHEVYLI